MVVVAHIDKQNGIEKKGVAELYLEDIRSCYQKFLISWLLDFCTEKLIAEYNKLKNILIRKILYMMPSLLLESVLEV